MAGTNLSALQPARFDYDEEARALLVEWTDGVIQRIPFGFLRRNCPCAACAGELNFSGRFATNPRLRPGEDELADISLVGSYGLNLVWADGHNTGIYTYPRLRALGDGQGIAPAV
ncbi:MAG: gamma-butyrobetaine hydroxylase-like domain-containing protein [Candidatus Dormibacteria bacterium]